MTPILLPEDQRPVCGKKPEELCHALYIQFPHGTHVDDRFQAIYFNQEYQAADPHGILEFRGENDSSGERQDKNQFVDHDAGHKIAP